MPKHFLNNIIQVSYANRFDEEFSDGNYDFLEDVTHCLMPFNKYDDKLYGSAAVRDLKGNNHFVATHGDSTIKGTKYHVEEWLTSCIVDHYNRGTGLTGAKVSFFMAASPCTECTPKISGMCANIIKSIVKEGAYNEKGLSAESLAGSPVYFVFNFYDYHALNDCNKKSKANRFPSRDIARLAYDEITKAHGRTGLLPSRDKMVTVPVINFRVVDQKSFERKKLDKKLG